MHSLRKYSLSVGIAMCLLFSPPSLAANAAPPSNLPEELITEVTEVWTENGVALSTQQALIAKMESGEVLDANLGGQPVSQQETDDIGEVKIVSTYADGSISVTRLEKPSEDVGGATNRGVQGCSVSSNPQATYYRGCSANGWFTAVVLSFFVDYDAYQSSTQIMKRWAPTVQCAAVNCTTPTFEDIRFTGTNSAPAQVNLVTTWSAAIGSGTTRLIFYSKPSNHGYTN